jgi:hypothetical protein
VSDALAWTPHVAGGLDSERRQHIAGQYFRRTNLAQKPGLPKTKKSGLADRKGICKAREGECTTFAGLSGGRHCKTIAVSLNEFAEAG